MAKRKVMAYYMHEGELAAAQDALTNIEHTESYLVGDVDEDGLRHLEEQGVLVQILEEEEPVAAEEAGPPTTGFVPPWEVSADNTYEIRLSGPLLEQWREELKAIGCALLDSRGPQRFRSRCQPDVLPALHALPFVTAVRPLPPDEARTSLPEGTPIAKDIDGALFDLRLIDAAAAPAVRATLDDMGVTIVAAGGRKMRLRLPLDAPEVDDIAALPEVARLEPYVPPALHNDVARRLLGLDPDDGGEPRLSQTGAGQVVAVADTGLDQDHPDFDGRILDAVGLGRPGDPDDRHGHGTHVAGSAVGSGAASEGRYRGIAPEARLYFQALEDDMGALGGLPLDLFELFEPAYDAGARIHNNSWGSATAAEYTLNAVEVDEFVAEKRDMLVVISAGNEGQAARRQNSRPGFVDWLSIGSPASCKNALTVGACRSERTNGGLATLTHALAWPDSFPDPPIGEEPVSGDPEAIAGFSSRGPCQDRRIKPDVVAPGTDIISARAANAPLQNFWGPVPNDDKYAFFGGTSMAAPLVAGCAALVRQYYIDEQGHEPSAALLKATLINGTRRLSAADATADFDTIPNFHQGFGCIHLPWTIPNPSRPDMQLRFVDDWQDPDGHFRRTGQRFRYEFNCDGGEWLRLCLVYTDPPARGLQNNLNLILERNADRQKWVGNAGLPLALTPFDGENNIEIIRLNAPEPGGYRVQITASNLLHPGQDFALVVCGAVGELDA